MTMTTDATVLDEVGQITREFFGTTPYIEWKGQTVAVNLDTKEVIRGVSCAEIAEKYGPNFVVLCFGKVDAALRPRRVR